MLFFFFAEMFSKSYVVIKSFMLVIKRLAMNDQENHFSLIDKHTLR